MLLPPALGFTADKGPMPPSAGARNKLFDSVTAGLPLVFDLELVAIMDDLLDRGDYDDGDEDDLQSRLQQQQFTSPPP